MQVLSQSVRVRFKKINMQMVKLNRNSSSVLIILCNSCLVMLMWMFKVFSHAHKLYIVNSTVKTTKSKCSSADSHLNAPYILTESAHSVLWLEPVVLLAVCLRCVRQPIQTGQQLRLHPILKLQLMYTSWNAAFWLRVAFRDTLDWFISHMCLLAWMSNIFWLCNV